MPDDIVAPSYWTLIKKYMFFYWDGIGFFGYADYKLPRLHGRSPSYLDKLKSVKEILILSISSIVLITILVSQLSSLG